MVCCCCCDRVGNTARCLGGRCNVGPHWACNLAAWALILGITACFNVFCGIRLHYGVVIVNCLSGLVLVASFALTSFTDPGYLPRQTPAQLERQKAELESAPASFQHMDAATGVLSADPAPMLQYTACARCNVMRGRGTQHCYDCGLCVQELDHREWRWGVKHCSGAQLLPRSFTPLNTPATSPEWPLGTARALNSSHSSPYTRHHTLLE